MEITCGYRAERAQWSDIHMVEQLKCLGYGACQTNGGTASQLEDGGADVRTCTNLQDGDYCKDFRCIDKFKIRRAEIRCKFGVWDQVDEKYCDACAAGQQKINASACVDCPPGKYKDNEVTVCTNCPAGQYQDEAGQAKCTSCENGEYQNNMGQTKCKECKWYLQCSRGDNSAVNPYVVVALLLILAAIPAIYKVVQWVIQAITAWKPQSKADAALAKKFVVPKKAENMVPIVSAFKNYEQDFVAHGWTHADQQSIKGNCDEVAAYLGSRVQEAAGYQQIRIMQCCLKMDVLHTFKTLYDATMGNIRHKERVGFNYYTATVHNAQNALIKCPRNPSELFELYDSGRSVYDRFHTFIAKAAKASDDAQVYQSHSGRPGMKGIYRVLEKGVFKYNDDCANVSELDLGQVRDLVRGGIIGMTMEGVATIANYIFTSEEVTVCRVKDRFNEPSGAGWTDLMINFYLNNDPGKHVCEVQIMHFKMYSQRTTQEGHDAYNVHRVRAAPYCTLLTALTRRF